MFNLFSRIVQGQLTALGNISWGISNSCHPIVLPNEEFPVNEPVIPCPTTASIFCQRGAIPRKQFKDEASQRPQAGSGENCRIVDCARGYPRLHYVPIIY
ncbi:hypothetical protein K439DRAFT_685881 [Ramaria rubella]|nr:hypothetical protein K439DRAFT_685881 [Ramaria rubella]